MNTALKERNDRLEKLGFSNAAKRNKARVEKKRKLAIAYEHYRYVRLERIEQFNKELRNKTYNWDKQGGYHKLELTNVALYGETPPDSVLTKMEEAINLRCFDEFEVAHIRKVKDPLLLGVVNGCTDRFIIDQWDEDIKISDLLKDNEG